MKRNLVLLIWMAVLLVSAGLFMTGHADPNARQTDASKASQAKTTIFQNGRTAR